MKSIPVLLVLGLIALFSLFEDASAGHGHHHHGGGTACIVKGSYCNCHYCKCEKGHVHCSGYGKHGHGNEILILNLSLNFIKSGILEEIIWFGIQGGRFNIIDSKL